MVNSGSSFILSLYVLTASKKKKKIKENKRTSNKSTVCNSGVPYSFANYSSTFFGVILNQTDYYYFLIKYTEFISLPILKIVA